jgi:formylglycine-generating enzyme
MVSTAPRVRKHMAWIPGGTMSKGAEHFYPEERPVHRATVDGFWMDEHPVTNAEFRRFVKATDYVTSAERAPDPADYPAADPALLVPGSVVFQKAPGPVSLADHLRWWAYVPHASWRRPEGQSSSLDGRDRHPVVHVTYDDALAYATWAGKELPAEAEWEYAARGGLDGAVFPWGDEFAPKGRQMANTWQGEFPWQNLRLDGHEGTSPVGSFPPNGYGLFDVVGNVWEWTSDWYAPYAAIIDETVDHEGGACCGVSMTRTATAEHSFAADQPDAHIPRRVIKGGSHLCAPNYCLRYRPAARQGQAIDSSTSHLGFRCVAHDPSPDPRG